MKKIIIAFIFLLIPSTAFPRAVLGFPLNKTSHCVNYTNQLSIVGKIAPKKYEVSYIGRNGDGPHFILITNETEFTADGLIQQTFWARVPDQKYNETVKVEINGFVKDVDVVYESEECKAKSKTEKDRI